MRRGLHLSLGVEVRGKFVLIVQGGSRIIIQTLLGRNRGGLGLVVIGKGWLRNRLGLRGE